MYNQSFYPSPFLSQRVFRGHCARKEYRESRYAICRLQAIFRGRNARARFDQLRRVHAALAIQAVWRMHTARHEFVEQQKAAMAVQTAYRCIVSGGASARAGKGGLSAAGLVCAAF